MHDLKVDRFYKTQTINGLVATSARSDQDVPAAGHQGVAAILPRRPAADAGGHGRVLQSGAGTQTGPRRQESLGGLHAPIVGVDSPGLRNPTVAYRAQGLTPFDPPLRPLRVEFVADRAGTPSTAVGRDASFGPTGGFHALHIIYFDRNPGQDARPRGSHQQGDESHKVSSKGSANTIGAASDSVVRQIESLFEGGSVSGLTDHQLLGDRHLAEDAFQLRVCRHAQTEPVQPPVRRAGIEPTAGFRPTAPPGAPQTSGRRFGGILHEQA